MINDRNSDEKISIEFPYKMGTTMEFKEDANILARICQYRIAFENNENVIYVGLCFDVYSNNPVIHYEISSEELEKYWKKTDKVINTKINSVKPLKYKYVHSNDEKVIADLLANFEYDLSQKEEKLAKYRELKKYIK